MRLDDDTYEFIKGEVVYIFEKYDVRCVPISGFEIATKMGIELIPYSSLDDEQIEVAWNLSPDGFLADIYALNMKRTIIYYNDKMLYSRINMTILHEIGHYVLDHHEKGDKEEAEANFFAKYASAPPPLIDEIHPESWKDIQQEFKTSREASEFAFQNYKNWLEAKKWRNNSNLDYENRLLELFNIKEGDEYCLSKIQ